MLFNNNFIKNENILQQLQTIEFKLDTDNDLLCRLQYGIPNRNMPADLMEKIFLIDIDGFTNSKNIFNRYRWINKLYGRTRKSNKVIRYNS